MKQRLKRILCTLLFTSFLFSFAACGRIPESSSSEKEEESSSQKQSESTTKEQTPVIEKNGLRLFVVSDIHYHHKDHDNDEEKTNQYGYTASERMQMIIDDILAEHAKCPLDGVVILGDLGGNNYTIKPYVSADKTYVDSSYFASEGDDIYHLDDIYFSQLRRRGIEIYPLVGNHDVYPDEYWEAVLGHKKDYIVEFPEYDTALLFVDIYGFDLSYPFFNGQGETVSAARATRSAENLATLDEIFAKAKNYGHVILCAHNNMIDTKLSPYIQSLDNIDVFLSGDGHRVKELTPKITGVPSYMMGVYSYSIAEEAKVANGYGTPQILVKPDGTRIAKPWTVDLRTSDYADCSFRDATKEELADAATKSTYVVYTVTPEEALTFFRWNYSILETDKNGDGLKATVVYPEITYHGISKTTGHILRPHFAMFPSVYGDWKQEYEEKILFDFGKVIE